MPTTEPNTVACAWASALCAGGLQQPNGQHALHSHSANVRRIAAAAARRGAQRLPRAARFQRCQRRARRGAHASQAATRARARRLRLVRRLRLRQTCTCRIQPLQAFKKLGAGNHNPLARTLLKVCAINCATCMARALLF